MVFYYQFAVSISTLVLIFVLILSLIRFYYRDIAKAHTSFRTILVWDRRNGMFPNLRYAAAYLPQYNAQLIVSKLEGAPNEPLKNLMKSHSELREDLTIVRQLFERLLFFTLGRRPCPVDLSCTMKKYSDVLGTNHPFLLQNDSDDIALQVPGVCDVSYHITSPGGGLLDIQWKKQFEGSLSLSFGSHIGRSPYHSVGPEGHRVHRIAGMTLKGELPSYLDGHELVASIYYIIVRLNFSPLDLYLNRRNSRKLYRWANIFLEDLKSSMDWDQACAKAHHFAL